VPELRIVSAGTLHLLSPPSLSLIPSRRPPLLPSCLTRQQGERLEGGVGLPLVYQQKRASGCWSSSSFGNGLLLSDCLYSGKGPVLGPGRLFRHFVGVLLPLYKANASSSISSGSLCRCACNQGTHPSLSVRLRLCRSGRPSVSTPSGLQVCCRLHQGLA